MLRCRGGAGGAEAVQGRCRWCREGAGGAGGVQATCTVCTSASIISGAGRCRGYRHTSAHTKVIIHVAVTSDQTGNRRNVDDLWARVGVLVCVVDQ